MRLVRHLTMLIGIALALVAGAAIARVEKITVHGSSLEGNLEGNSPDRTVIVALPPSYGKAPHRRYPVVYFLHGFTAHAESTFKDFRMEARIDAFTAATGKEFILVAPDSYTRHGGSYYANSVTVGNFEDFIAKDLIRYIDGHYRTLARRESRGLMGHSMGGYGTLRVAMKHPELFAAIYAFNPCCLAPRGLDAQQSRMLETMSLETALKGDFLTHAYFATAAAWSPDPNKPPFYADLPTRNGEIDPLVVAKWHANAPTAMLPQYLTAIRSLRAIGMETGAKDFVRNDVLAMHAELLRFGIAHDWTDHDGDHGNRVSERLATVVFPFFAKNLVFRMH